MFSARQHWSLIVKLRSTFTARGSTDGFRCSSCTELILARAAPLSPHVNTGTRKMLRAGLELPPELPRTAPFGLSLLTPCCGGMGPRLLLSPVDISIVRQSRNFSGLQFPEPVKFLPAACRDDHTSPPPPAVLTSSVPLATLLFWVPELPHFRDRKAVALSRPTTALDPSRDGPANHANFTGGSEACLGGRTTRLVTTFFDCFDYCFVIHSSWLPASVRAVGVVMSL